MPPARADRNGRGSSRILIVDSDARRGAATAAKLEDAYVVELVSGGSEALSALATGPEPNAVVIERDLPDVDGFVLARRIRNGRAQWNTRTIVLAGNAGGPPSGRVRKGFDACFVEEDGAARGMIVALAISLLAAA
jgi:CheY-like chemotaxis protein